AKHSMDILKREFHRPQLHDDPRFLDFAFVVEAVARNIVHRARHEEALLVIEPERLDRKAGDLRELANAIGSLHSDTGLRPPVRGESRNLFATASTPRKDGFYLRCITVHWSTASAAVYARIRDLQLRNK